MTLDKEVLTEGEFEEAVRAAAEIARLSTPEEGEAAGEAVGYTEVLGKAAGAVFLFVMLVRWGVASEREREREGKSSQRPSAFNNFGLSAANLIFITVRQAIFYK